MDESDLLAHFLFRFMPTKIKRSLSQMEQNSIRKRSTTRESESITFPNIKPLWNFRDSKFGLKFSSIFTKTRYFQYLALSNIWVSVVLRIATFFWKPRIRFCLGLILYYRICIPTIEIAAASTKYLSTVWNQETIEQTF